MQAVFRLYSGCIQAVFRLYQGSVKEASLWYAVEVLARLLRPPLKALKASS
jgi:hypothetical protein